MSDGGSPALGGEMHPAAAPGEVELGYRRMPMLADYLRGWTGLGLSGLPLVTMQPSWPIGLALLALAGLFAGFLRQTWRRQHSRLRLAASGVALIGMTGDRSPGASSTASGCAGSAPAAKAAAGSSWSCVAAARDWWSPRPWTGSIRWWRTRSRPPTIAACASSPRPGPTSRRCWAAPPDADQPPESSWR